MIMKHEKIAKQPTLRKVRNTLSVAAVAAVAGFAAQADETAIKLGVIMEARPAEQPWSASMFESIERLEAEDARVSHVKAYDAYDPTKSEPIARQMLAEGHNVMIMQSFALNDVTHTLAAENPGVPFAVSSWDTPKQPNLNITSANYIEMAYPSCWLLARLSETGKIGFVGAVPLPYTEDMEAGCEAGAKAARDDAEVLVAYSNSFVDQQATREQAQGLLDQGADVLYPMSATQDSLGAFGLCEQTGALCAGWGSDARRYAPTTGVNSIMVDWTVLLKDFANQVRTGKLEAKTWIASFGNDSLISQPFDGPAGEHVSAELQAEFGDLLDQLKAGAIELPVSVAYPPTE